MTTVLATTPASGGAPVLHRLSIQPLTAEAFSRFGDVIESAGHAPIQINHGMTERYHALAQVDTGGAEGHALINLFHALPYELPLRLEEMERHPLGSQAFVPLQETPFIVVVAAAGESVQPCDLQAFVTNGRQGVNYHRGIWHHSLIALQASARFIVVDRGGPGHNCDVVAIGDGCGVLLELPDAG
ncbi:ureidoglycolate lyase [Comamonas testosteroni]|uniref:Ureidoglycolate hydrolase n=1 Tax=Comamonas testosteroni (strain DSM 14576 / KF-1) TaxID=399795 RepID=B7X0G4_COMTK|nr:MULTISPECIES: ureidoglycolate lyase [Comamonas]EED66314.1 Ureidoglycolate hydrolase [Comamonas testosteroni KF-1]TYK68289.1 ureidoglycolate lyase [Comamonas sp. Z3]WQG64567.1 ureidoglycolate lyase [Comamonas testosteroni]